MTSNKLLVVNVVVTIALVGGLITGFNLVKKRQLIQTQAKFTEMGITIANLTNASFSVWWKGPDLQIGCVTMNAQAAVCDNRPAVTHLISLTNLTVGQTYQIVVKHGQTTIPLSPFWGQGIHPLSPPKYDSPDIPLTGQVITSDGQPLDQATVFIAPNLSDRMYLPLAAVTNDQGEFFFANLSDLKFQRVADLDDYFVEVTDKNGNKLLETVISKDLLKTPFTITVP